MILRSEEAAGVGTQPQRQGSLRAVAKDVRAMSSRRHAWIASAKDVGIRITSMVTKRLTDDRESYGQTIISGIFLDAS